MLGKAGLPIGIGIVAVLALVVWQFWSGGRRPLVPPERLAERALELSETVETRREAAQQLGDWGQQAYADPAVRERAAPVFQRVLRESNDPIVRSEALRGITAARDWDAMELVLMAMEDEDPIVRGRAGAAAQKLLGVDFGYRANDPPAKRERILNGIRQEFQKMQSALASAGRKRPGYGPNKE